MPTIASVAIVTKDRPRSLVAALRSHIENRERFRRKHGFVIADGSELPGSRKKSLDMLRGLAAQSAAPIFYAGAPEKQAFVTALVRAGIPRRAANFALFGSGFDGPWTAVGADRNAILLHTAGTAVFCADDDVFCRQAAPPLTGDPRSAMKPALEGSPEEWWFFENRAEISRTLEFNDEDVLAPHERFLGKPTPPGLCAGYGRVIATLNGLAGDCALRSPHAYLRLEGASRERLLKSRATYRRALSRQVLRVAAKPTAASGSGFTTWAAALDNSSVLPPFMPSFHDEDGLFGALLSLALPERRFIHLPRALWHAPPKARIFSRRDFRKMFPGERVNDFLIMLLQLFKPAANLSGERNLRALGRHLGDIARRLDFQDLMRTQTRRARALQIISIQRLLDSHGRAPSFWAADVEAYRANLEKSLACDAENAFGDTGGARADKKEVRAKFRRLTTVYGELLELWPDIWTESKRLREKGVCLAKPV